MTIAQGMEQTGGYMGTDLDNSEEATLMQQMINIHMSSYEAEHLTSLKKRRRQLREKVLCAENCKLEKWSFLNGIKLDKHCPTDCPVYEMNGSMAHKTSLEALKAYNSYFEIKDMQKNKKILKGLDYQINEQEEIVEKFKEKTPPEELNAHKEAKADEKPQP